MITRTSGTQKPLPERGHLAFSLILASAAISSGVGTGSAVGPLLGLFITVVLVVRRRGPIALPSRVVRLAIPASVLAGALSPYLLGTTYWSTALGLSIVGSVLALFTLHHPRLSLATLPLFPVAAGLILLFMVPGETIDVWFLHRDAGNVVLEGGNPWTDLTTPNGAPGAIEDTISGYPYPPVPLLAYAIFGAVAGEPRLMTLLSWVAVAGCFAWVARSRPGVMPFGWLLVVQPTWALMLWAGWTEPLSIALAVAAWATWDRFPIARNGVLGVLLGSKQYFLPVGIIIARARSVSPRSRIAVLGVAAAVTAIAVVWGWSAAYDALVGFHSQQPARADGLTLFGLGAALGIDLPFPPLLAPAAALALATTIRTTSDQRTAHSAAAAVLAVFFLLGIQSFANYWFIVLALVVLTLTSTDATRSDSA